MAGGVGEAVAGETVTQAAQPDAAALKPWFIPILALLTSFGPVAIDMYLPALPVIAREFGVGQGTVQMTLSWFLFGFGGGQLVWGPLADRFGRKRPAAAGILLFGLASAGCALASDVDHLSAWRFLQGIGACAAPVLARAMVRDSFTRDRAAATLSLMMLVMGVAPMLAPLAGGQVLGLSTWRTIFWVQVGFALLALGGLATLAETLPAARRSRSAGPLAMLRGYGLLLADRRFLGYTLSSGFVYAGMFAYISGTPFVYIEYFQVPARYYGFLFGVNVIGMMAVNSFNARAVMRHGPGLLLRRGTQAAAVLGLVLLASGGSGIWGGGAGGIAGVAVPLFFYLATTGVVGANGMAAALEKFPTMAGAASALAGTIQLSLGALVGGAVGLLSTGTPLAMCAIIAACGLAGVAVNRLLLGRIA
ncbi:Bcr/CflA family multidrug efflux MFS transporter [Oleisolibacter albus]|uniref:Bcr/CflA family multidrug efflux MFS transporter n=1 Tax=Oleisolibacter albus TaxID=2171757 RepID=UPI00138FBDA0|nr:Bcr/CflA family multidrug efflux MFS transporter [Oleisolibacter albus]